MKYRIVEKQNNALLVEWQDAAGNLQRSVMPADMLGLELSEADLEAGIPYGAGWTLPTGTLETLRKRLHKQGIWTYADATVRVREFRALVSEIIAAALLDAARGGLR